MSNAYIYIIGFILAGFAVHYLFFSRKAVISGMLSKTKSEKIGDVVDGDLVKIKGKIVYAGRTLTAPLSKRKCVYYHVTVKDSSSQKEVLKNHIHIDDEKAADVVIYDGTHYAVINTKLVSSYIIQDEEFYSGFWNATTPELKEFLVKHGERATDYIGWSLDLFAEEGVLEEGELITVAGKATWRKASEFRFKIPADKILYIDSLNEHGVYLTDDPYSG